MTTTPPVGEERVSLLPCPFCGSPGITHENDWADPPIWSVVCAGSDCFASVREARTEAEAIAAWNRRSRAAAAITVWNLPASPPAPGEGEVDKLLKSIRADVVTLQETLREDDPQMAKGADLTLTMIDHLATRLSSQAGSAPGFREGVEAAARVAERDCTPGYGPHRSDMEALAEIQRRNIAERIRSLLPEAQPGGKGEE